jgi:phosphoribosylamine-glycine ligase
MTKLPHTTEKRKVLIVTDEWLAPSLSLALQNEGCDVALAAKRSTNILRGTIRRIAYGSRMEYAKSCDLVVYEDTSNDGEPSKLREMGLSVIGRDKLTDKLELDREWSANVARKCGLLVPEVIKINSFEEIRDIITTRGGQWVLKQQGKLDEIKGLNFVAKMPNSEDLLDFLPIMERNWVDGVEKDFVMQEKIDGHEFAIGSYWNGHEFMKDSDGDEICVENWEHKSLFPGNLGESTGEQFTVLQYVKARDSKLFMDTLNKCRPLLEMLDFKGDFDINTIVNEKGAYFLEFTPRMGVPLTSGQLEIHKSSWYDFFKAMADGKQDPNFKYDDRFCIVCWVYTKPFPFINSDKMGELYEKAPPPKSMSEIADVMSYRMSNSEDIVVNFKKDFTKDDWTHLHPDGIRFKDGKLKVGNPDGFILTGSEMDDTVEGAGEKLNAIFKKIVVPKIFWRNDFSSSNYHKSKDDLTKWGYLEPLEKRKKKQEDIVLSESEEKRKKIRASLKKIVYGKK